MATEANLHEALQDHPSFLTECLASPSQPLSCHPALVHAGVQDRQMLVSILLLSAVCMLALLRTPWLLLLHSYTWLQYSLAVGALYCLMNALEGTIIRCVHEIMFHHSRPFTHASHI